MYRPKSVVRSAVAGIALAAFLALPVVTPAQTPPRSGAAAGAGSDSSAGTITEAADPAAGIRSTMRTVPVPPAPEKVVLVFESRDRIVEALPPELQGLLNRLPGGARPWIYERAALGPIQQVSTAAGVMYQLTLTSDEDFGKIRDYYRDLVETSGLSGVHTADRGNGVSINVGEYRLDVRPVAEGVAVRLTVVHPD
jgi:hypothetical protein